MKVIQDNLGFNKVYWHFLRNHIGSHGFSSTSWAIRSANKELRTWQLVQLELEEIVNRLLLINHRHPSGAPELVPVAGMTISVALEHLRSHAAEYSVNNKDCYDLIMAKGTTPFNPIFLSTKPIGMIHEHQGLVHNPGSLIHLDGLHRLLGWAYAGKLSDGYPSNPKKLVAFIVGDLPSGLHFTATETVRR